MFVFMMVTCGLTLIMLMIQFRSYGYAPKTTDCNNTSLIEKYDGTLQTLCVEKI